MTERERDKHAWRDAGLLMAGAALAWLGGVALQLQQAQLWALGWWYAGVAFGGVCASGAVVLDALRGPRSMRSRWLPWAAALLGATALGFGVTGLRAVDRSSASLAVELEGEDLVLTGVVASLPQVGSSGVRFRFDVEQARWRGEAGAGAAAHCARLVPRLARRCADRRPAG